MDLRLLNISMPVLALMTFQLGNCHSIGTESGLKVALGIGQQSRMAPVAPQPVPAPRREEPFGTSVQQNVQGARNSDNSGVTDGETLSSVGTENIQPGSLNLQDTDGNSEVSIAGDELPGISVKGYASVEDAYRENYERLLDKRSEYDAFIQGRTDVSDYPGCKTRKEVQQRLSREMRRLTERFKFTQDLLPKERQRMINAGKYPPVYGFNYLKGDDYYSDDFKKAGEIFGRGEKVDPEANEVSVLEFNKLSDDEKSKIKSTFISINGGKVEVSSFGDVVSMQRDHIDTLYGEMGKSFRLEDKGSTYIDSRSGTLYYNQCAVCSLDLKEGDILQLDEVIDMNGLPSADEQMYLNFRDYMHRKGGLRADEKYLWSQLAKFLEQRIFVYDCLQVEYIGGREDRDIINGFFVYGDEYKDKGTKRVYRKNGHYQQLVEEK